MLKRFIKTFMIAAALTISTGTFVPMANGQAIAKTAQERTEARKKAAADRKAAFEAKKKDAAERRARAKKKAEAKSKAWKAQRAKEKAEKAKKRKSTKKTPKRTKSSKSVRKGKCNIVGLNWKSSHPRLKDGLCKLSKRYGKIHITSSCRSHKHNRGAKHSYHLYSRGCKAADLYIVGVKGSTIRKWWAKNMGGGRGSYSCRRFVHVDVGTNRTWHWNLCRK